MTQTTLADVDEYVRDIITHTEALEILGRMCNSHFNNPGEHMRASIPANPGRDDDLRMHAYIKQQEAKIGMLADKFEKMHSDGPLGEFPGKFVASEIRKIP